METGPDNSTNQWHAEPTSLFSILESHQGPIIVDLDETLYLSNSTEDFISCIQPRALGKASMAVLNRLRPWALTGEEATRDVWRVLITIGLFPWTVLIWRWRCRDLLTQNANWQLRDYLIGRQDVVIATNGFGLIVRTLIAGLLPARSVTVTCRLSFSDRRAGKLALLDRCIGREAVSKSLVITDSMDDSPLLSVCDRGCLVQWPFSKHKEALSDVYLPFEYLARVKRPNSRYIWRSVIQEDFAFWILASSSSAHAFPFVLSGLALLCVSFWAAYETGYVDNDCMARRFERDPVLSASFAGHRVPTPVWMPWLWAATFGIAGVTVLNWPAPTSPLALLSWAALLAGTKACFTLFNRIDKRTRIWLFAPLQSARAAGILVVASTSAIGIAGLCAHAIALWIPYVYYRYKPGAGWPDLPTFAFRLLIFLVFAVMLLLGGGAAVFDWPLAGAFLAWNLFRARKEIAAIVRAAYRIDRPQSEVADRSKTSGSARVAR